ncbi:protein disulfide-isomerase [Microplitis demolitor]|uniref:protein disulfide-isomerase n=1 Tax=Microplitis demolitor TaxID=69319 RepID=UPI0004CDAE49|nr:protein disulfide-isomerase [Microplitis demolitor]
MGLVGILFVTALSVVVSFADIATEDGVLVITKDNFEQAVKDHSYILIEFYAPWCGHCKALAPEYAKAAKALEEEGSKIKLGKVDATIESELAEKNGVRGYPTLKFYRNGSPIDYSGGRQADDIVSWLSKKTGPPAKDLPSVDEAKALIDASDVVVIGFFKNPESEDAKVFMDVAQSIDEQVFGISSDDKVFDEYEAKDGTVILFKKFDEGRSVYDSEIDAEKLKEFIAVHSLPLVVDFSQQTAQKIFGGEVKSHLLAFISKEAGDYDKYVEGIKTSANKYRGKILFVTVNIDESDHERILEFFGMKKEDVPAMRIIKLEQDMAKYKPENPELSEENVLEFVTAFFEDRLKRHLLTEDLPEDWDKKPVKVLVGTNFYEVAHDKSKNVLVEFYAPWCGHCKQLVPIYDKLGEKYESDENVVIAKMDATANELETINIKSFPTIILYKKETNEAVEYNGERTLEGLSKFIDSDGAYGQAAEEVQEEDEDDDVPRKDEL